MSLRVNKHLLNWIIITIIIIIIIITIIINITTTTNYHLYTGCLQLYTWNNPCFLGIQYCSYSVVTIDSASNAIWNVISIVLYISTFRSMCAVASIALSCSSLISCSPGMLLRYFLYDFEMVPAAPIITVITFVFFPTPHALSLYHKVFIFQTRFGFFLDNISISWNCNVYEDMFLLHYVGLWCPAPPPSLLLLTPQHRISYP